MGRQSTIYGVGLWVVVTQPTSHPALALKVVTPLPATLEGHMWGLHLASIVCLHSLRSCEKPIQDTHHPVRSRQALGDNNSHSQQGSRKGISLHFPFETSHPHLPLSNNLLSTLPTPSTFLNACPRPGRCWGIGPDHTPILLRNLGEGAPKHARQSDRAAGK